MSQFSVNDGLLELFDEFYDEAISSEGMSALAQGLVEDRQTLELFVDYIDFRADLPQCVSSPGEAPAAPVAASTSRPIVAASPRHTDFRKPPVRMPQARQSAERDAAREARAVSDRVEVADPRPMFIARAVDVLQQPIVASLLVATTTTLVGLLAFSQIYIGGKAETPSGPTAAGWVEPQEIEFVAHLAAEVDCRWGDASDVAFLGAHLRAGQKLELREGTAKLVFNSGAVALLEGPTVFILETENRGRLNRGRVFARVDRRAAGFTVVAPGATLIDLGTEFGVYVDADGATEAYVFKGKIKAVRATPASGDGQSAAAVLRAGEGVRVAVGESRLVRDENIDGGQFAFRMFLSGERKPSPPKEFESNVVLLSDDFDEKYLDPAKWTIDLSTASGGDPSVSLFGGQVNFRDRGYLNTADDFKPSDYDAGKYAGGIKIAGRWTFNSPIDHFEIATRSDGTPHGPYGVVRNGVVFAFYHGNPAPGAWAILEQTEGKLAYVVPQTPLSPPISSDMFDFEITDDGVRVSFTVKEVGGRENTWTIRGETRYTNPRGRNKIAFYNRERTTTASCLDDLVIQTGLAK